MSNDNGTGTFMAIDYVSRARALQWEDLLALWKRIEARDTSDWAAGKAFEHLILRAFELSDDNVKITWPYDVPLGRQVVEQIDGMVVFHHMTCLVEVKDTEDPVNAEPIAKLRNQLLRRPAGVLGCIFSVSGFTDPATTLAQYSAPQAILLWNGQEISRLLRAKTFTTALVKKFEYLVQMAIPDLNITEELGG